MIIDYGPGLSLFIDGLGSPSSSVGFSGTVESPFQVIMFTGDVRRLDVKLRQSDGTFLPPQDEPVWLVDDHSIVEIGTIVRSRQAVNWHAMTVGTANISFSTTIDGVEHSVFFSVQVVAPDAIIIDGPVIEIL